MLPASWFLQRWFSEVAGVLFWGVLGLSPAPQVLSLPGLPLARAAQKDKGPWAGKPTPKGERRDGGSSSLLV